MPSERNAVLTASVKAIANYKDCQQTDQCLYGIRKNHDISICTEFVKSPLFQRWKFVRSRKLCYKYLKFGHYIPKCPTNENCKLCGENHHLSLHNVSKKFANIRQRGQNIRNSKEIDISTNLWLAPTPLLKSVPITVADLKGSKTIYAFLDDGATVTMISAKLLKNIGGKSKKSKCFYNNKIASLFLNKYPDSAHSLI